MPNDNEQRLRPKYIVRKIEPGVEVVPLQPGDMASTNPDDVDSPFVLMPRKDPAAFLAMTTYAQYCEPQLRAEIGDWLSKIAKAPPIYGTQGARNYESIRLRAVSEV